MYATMVQDMYDETKTSVKYACKETENFTVKIRIH